MASPGRSKAAAVAALTLIALLAALAPGSQLNATARAANAPADAHVSGHVIVKYRNAASASAIAAAQQQVHGSSVGDIPDLGARLLQVPAGSESSAVAALGHNPNVQYAELDAVASAADVTPNDPYFPWSGSGVILGGQWGDGLTQVQKAWSITEGSPGAIVAIVDSGVDFAHPDLAGQGVPGVSEVGGDTTDTSGHGEYVAGTVGEIANNGIGAAGYCWSCKVMPVKITSTGSASYSAMAAGITWATDHGARVINVSYAGTSQSSTLDSAVAYAASHGAIVVAAAGNSGCNCASYPAASPGAIGVAASDQADNLMNYSNWGSWVQVAAPTGDITTWLTDPMTGQPYGYGPVGGTSISSPVVAGILALLFSYQPNATVAQVENALFSSVDPITGLTQGGSPVNVKYGRVNAYKALLALGGQLPSPSPTASATPSPTLSPSQSPSPSPSPSASPSPTPSPTSSPTPGPTGTSTVIFTGSVNAKQAIRTFSITVGAGSCSVGLSATGGLGLSLIAPGGAAIAQVQGSSTTLTALVSPGTYTLQVSYQGSKASFKLTATYPSP